MIGFKKLVTAVAMLSMAMATSDTEDMCIGSNIFNSTEPNTKESHDNLQRTETGKQFTYKVNQSVVANPKTMKKYSKIITKNIGLLSGMKSRKPNKWNVEFAGGSIVLSEEEFSLYDADTTHSRNYFERIKAQQEEPKFQVGASVIPTSLSKKPVEFFKQNGCVGQVIQKAEDDDNAIDEQAQWLVKYGSVTVKIHGYEFMLFDPEQHGFLEKMTKSRKKRSNKRQQSKKAQELLHSQQREDLESAQHNVHRRASTSVKSM